MRVLCSLLRRSWTYNYNRDDGQSGKEDITDSSSEGKRRRQRNWLIALVVGIAVVIAGFVGGRALFVYSSRHSPSHEAMVRIVHSSETKKVIENGLWNMDPYALTSKGVIKTYPIDDEFIIHNRMGGIDLNVVINHD